MTATQETTVVPGGPAGVRTLADINRIGTAFFEARVVQSAVELGLCTELAKGPATRAEICDRLGLHPRGARDFLHALVVLGLLRRDGERYANSPGADEFLDRAKPSYGGAFLERAAQMMYPVWGRLTDLLRTGASQLPEQESQRATFERMMADPVRIERFLRMMDAVSGPLADDIAGAMDWSGYRSVLDVGGARGNLVAQIVGRHPHLAGAVFDLPAIEPSFHRHMAALGRTGAVSFTGGDFFADPMPAADVIIMGHVLHDWAPKERADLVAAAYRAVRPGGALLVYDPMVDESSGDVYNTMVSLNMALMSPGGSEYPLAECTQWLRQAGFGPCESRPIGDHDTLVIAPKPS